LLLPVGREVEMMRMSAQSRVSDEPLLTPVQVLEHGDPRGWQKAAS
jgi:hypothetical protein